MSAAVSMRVDERGLTSEELDDELPFGPAEDADDAEEHEPSAPTPCGLCDGVAMQGALLCERCRDDEATRKAAREAADRAPCLRCGAPPRPREYRARGTCEACIEAEKQEERDRSFAEHMARIDARAEEERLELERSPHRCAGGCGEHTREEGQRCDPCAARHRDERERIGHVHGFLHRLPVMYRDNDLDGPELIKRVKDATAIGRARAACTAETWCVTIVGPAGAGKTSLAVAVARPKVYARGRGEFAAARDLAFARSRAPLGAEPAIVETALGADVLVLDDLDLAPEVHGSAVVDVIHARHRDNLATIITTTLTPAETALRFGDGTARRVFERGMATVIELKSSKGPAR